MVVDCGVISREGSRTSIGRVGLTILRDLFGTKNCLMRASETNSLTPVIQSLMNQTSFTTFNELLLSCYYPLKQSKSG
jgi:hypothetical protein